MAVMMDVYGVMNICLAKCTVLNHVFVNPSILLHPCSGEMVSPCSPFYTRIRPFQNQNASKREEVRACEHKPIISMKHTHTPLPRSRVESMHVCACVGCAGTVAKKQARSYGGRWTKNTKTSMHQSEMPATQRASLGVASQPPSLLRPYE